MTKKLIDRLINKEYLTDRERREWLNQVKNNVILLETQNESLKHEYDILKFNLEEKVEVIVDLKKENQELKESFKISSNDQIYYRFNELKTEYQKLKKAIEILNRYIDIKENRTLLGKKYYHTLRLDYYENLTKEEYDLLKEVLE